MKAIESAFSNHPDFFLVSLRNARYPIVNAQHKPTGIDIQIVGAPDTHAQREAMAHYLHSIPQLRSVYMVLKTALGIRGLVDVFNGGIGSYGLFMMLTASLQRPHSNPPRTAAESLLRFLDFYSDLNMEKYGVSVAPPKLFKKHDVFTTATKSHIDAARRRGDNIRAAQWAIGQARVYQPYLFCLQDPADPLNDLGRKSNAIKHLQTTIRVFRNTLRKYLSDGFPYVPDPVPWLDGSLLLPLVGRCHEIYHERRSKAEMQGRVAVETIERTAVQAEEQGIREPVEQEAVEDELEGSGWADLEKEKAAA
jgi:non-canonical poly(A) RNA polymerase PAPD5/7